MKLISKTCILQQKQKDTFGVIFLVLKISFLCLKPVELTVLAQSAQLCRLGSHRGSGVCALALPTLGPWVPAVSWWISVVCLFPGHTAQELHFPQHLQSPAAQQGYALASYGLGENLRSALPAPRSPVTTVVVQAPSRQSCVLGGDWTQPQPGLEGLGAWPWSVVFGP